MSIVETHPFALDTGTGEVSRGARRSHRRDGGDGATAFSARSRRGPGPSSPALGVSADAPSAARSARGVLDGSTRWERSVDVPDGGAVDERPAVAEATRGGGVAAALAELVAATGSTTVRIPDTLGLAGLSRAELEAFAGGGLREVYGSPREEDGRITSSHALIAGILSDTGNAAEWALVVEEYQVLGLGVGAHAYLVRVRSDPDGGARGVVVGDPGRGAAGATFPPDLPGETRRVSVLLFDRRGDALAADDAHPLAGAAPGVGGSPR